MPPGIPTSSSYEPLSRRPSRFAIRPRTESTPPPRVHDSSTRRRHPEHEPLVRHPPAVRTALPAARPPPAADRRRRILRRLVDRPVAGIDPGSPALRLRQLLRRCPGCGPRLGHLRRVQAWLGHPGVGRRLYLPAVLRG